MIVFVLSSMALVIGALFGSSYIVYLSVIAIVIYSFLAPKMYKTDWPNHSK